MRRSAGGVRPEELGHAVGIGVLTIFEGVALRPQLRHDHGLIGKRGGDQLGEFGEKSACHRLRATLHLAKSRQGGVHDHRRVAAVELELAKGVDELAVSDQGEVSGIG